MIEESKKHCILIVDDEADFRNILKIKLESVGFSTMEATNGKEALTILGTTQPDVILLDMMMPEMGGIETLFKIKENDKTRHIRVIILTSKGDPREEIVRINRKFAQESGAFDYLRKETDLDEMIAKINGILVEDGKK